MRIRGARTHNLRDLSLDIPRDRLIVVTGLSGSGKSSLAFDTIYAEGQRRYVESLSTYARQVLGPSLRPDVDVIEGLPPTIAIAQQAGRSGPRSTVATITDIHDFLRLLFARVGEPHCPGCGMPITRHTLTQIVDAIMVTPSGSRLMILAPVVRAASGAHSETLARIGKQGFVRVRIDGHQHEASAVPPLEKNKPHDIDVVVDRLVMRDDLRARLTESIETALRLADGLVIASRDVDGDWADTRYCTRYRCPDCNLALPELEPRLFSFNSPHGACPACEGLGEEYSFDPRQIVPDPKLPLEAGAIAPWRRGDALSRPMARLLDQFCQAFNVSPSTPYCNLPAKVRDILLNGTSPNASGAAFEGVIPNLQRRWKESQSDALRERLAQYIARRPCPACLGARLRPEALAVKLDGKSIDELAHLSIDAAAGFFHAFSPAADLRPIAEPIVREIRQRLRFMIDVGIGYLTLARTTDTLSNGEAQRIRLATQIGSGLVGVCYVLDEPTIGLHPRDTARLIDTLRRLKAQGNTLFVVEHDPDVIAAGEWFIDLGPGAGAHGGRLLANGPRDALLASTESVTAAYVRGDAAVAHAAGRALREPDARRVLTVQGAAENNLQRIDVTFPLGLFCCVTGVSGSGKSTLVNQILLPALKQHLGISHDRPGAHRAITGLAYVDKVIEIDQSSIGRSPRSNPATYCGVFDAVRDLFARTREARARGYDAARFSFNARGGRCEACHGYGTRRVEMHFLPDLFVKCGDCGGTRYSRETLEIRYRGKSIADVLNLRAEEALAFFENVPAIRQTLAAVVDVGLGYLTLGQPAHMLSGGEAQRLKLAAELARSPIGHTLYVLDEPTSGLHFADIRRLLDVLHRLIDAGHSVIAIEHNLDVIRQADWIIDLGPEGGDAGGRLIAEGSPMQIAQTDTHTGRHLKRVMANEKFTPAASFAEAGEAAQKASTRDQSCHE
ncbi:MAG: excinuclease ABC subunit UvrA [Planctomycetia bacterium]|nr:MAG: excinuclease ABC subunit UvrA [Planctomycetia bacterium]RIK71454.1 MAG: excinuclease ABC subunit UvrA [Planctomycetota bacterium]